MTDTPALDPDEVACPRCGSPASVPCRTPKGRKAKGIHLERRRVVDPRTPPVATPTGKTFDKAAASEAGRKSAQARRRRRAEQEAAAEAAAEAALVEERRANAVRLAEDAVRYANDRAILKRHTLDAALLSHERLLEGLRGLQRIEVDDDGRPCTTPVERQNRQGDPITVEVPDVRGAYPAATVERLAKIAASTLNSVRLEEGSPTGIHRHEGDDPAEQLGEAGVRDLLAWAAENLEDGPS